MTRSANSQSIHELLRQQPLSYNELLDLFEAYVATIGGPINKGHDMLREVIGMGENTALGHIFGVACDAEDMAKRLKQLRAAHNTATDVTLILTRNEADRLEYTLCEMERMFSAAGSAFELLHDRAAADVENDDIGSMAVMSLAQRALMDTDEKEGAFLRLFSRKLREARQYEDITGEEAA